MPRPKQPSVYTVKEPAGKVPVHIQALTAPRYATTPLSQQGDVDWWHSALAARDEAALSSLQAHITSHNHDIASLANPLDLAVTRTSGDLLTFDPAEMYRRIEAAAAKHKNKGKRGDQAANRHLKYLCPACQKPARCASDSRILICAGTYERPHDPTPMEFDESSQPAYRLADKYGSTEIAPEGSEEATLGTKSGRTQTESQLKLAHAKRKAPTARLSAPLGADGALGPATPPYPDIPF